MIRAERPAGSDCPQLMRQVRMPKPSVGERRPGLPSVPDVSLSRDRAPLRDGTAPALRARSAAAGRRADVRLASGPRTAVVVFLRHQFSCHEMPFVDYATSAL